MCLHRIPKGNSWVDLLSQIRRQDFVAKFGNFLEKEFLSKEVSGRKVELDKVIEPSLQLVCGRAQEVVPVAPTPIEVEAYDSDHET